MKGDELGVILLGFGKVSTSHACLSQSFDGLLVVGLFVHEAGKTLPSLVVSSAVHSRQGLEHEVLGIVGWPYLSFEHQSQTVVSFLLDEETSHFREHLVQRGGSQRGVGEEETVGIPHVVERCLEVVFLLIDAEKTIEVLQIHPSDVGRRLLLHIVHHRADGLAIVEHLAHVCWYLVDDGGHGQSKRVFVGIAEGSALQQYLQETASFQFLVHL